MRQLSDMAGFNETYARDMLKRGREPTASRMKIIQKILKISENTELKTVPLISTVSAGALKHPDSSDVIDMLQATSLPHDDFFALRVDGRSMNRIAVDGATILVDRRSKVLKDRGFYVFEHEGEGVFKRYRSNPPRLEAYTYDEGYEDILLENEPVPVGEVKRVVVDL